mmetsp:Transcript_37832/g.38315  ORF Transcript_37832/g.38315 Transcript_37832/m.38315 type:complete len:131 (+) Transcript_37832:270-662(+)
MISTSTITQTTITTASGSRAPTQLSQSQSQSQQNQKLWMQKTEKRDCPQNQPFHQTLVGIKIDLRFTQYPRRRLRRCNKGTITISKKTDFDNKVSSVKRKKENMHSAMEILENTSTIYLFSFRLVRWRKK